MANTVTNILNEIWSPIIYRGLHEVSSSFQFLSRKWEGECKLGKTVHVGTPDSVTIRNYTGASITVEDMTPATTAITVDQAKYWAFAVDDVQEIHTKPGVMDLQLPEAIVTLAENTDEAIWAYLYAQATADVDASDAPTAGAGNAGIILTIDDDSATTSEMTPLEVLAVAGRKMDKLFIPREDRYAIVPPEFIEYAIRGGTILASNFPGVSLQALKEGKVQRMMGFNVQMSGKLTKATSIRHGVAFHRSCCAVGYALDKMETLRRESNFGDLVRGLLVYFRQIMDAGRVLDLKFAEA